MGLGSDLGDNKAVGGGFVGMAGLGLPASFTTTNMNMNMNMNMVMLHPPVSLQQREDRDDRGDSRRVEDEDEDAASGDVRDRDVLSKLVLARMQGLEESFREVLREVKDLKHQGTTTTTKDRSSRPPVVRRKSERDAVLHVKQDKKRARVVRSRVVGDADADADADADGDVSEYAGGFESDARRRDGRGMDDDGDDGKKASSV